MLRINLLPPYVTQRRLTKRLVPVFALLVILSVALPLLWYTTLSAHLKDVTNQAEDAKTKKDANDAIDVQTANTIAQVKPIQDKVDFAKAVHEHNRKQAELLSLVADESPRNNQASLIYSSMTPGAGYQTMVINAYSPSVETVGRYLQAMYQAPVFSSVSVDKIPGYPDNVQHRWYLGKTMVFADGATNSAGGGGGGYPGGGRGAAAGGYPGGGGGYPGGGGASAAAGSLSAASLAPNGPLNVPPGVGPPPAELVASAASSPAAGGYPGGAGGAQGGGYSANFLRLALAGVSPFATPEQQARILQYKLKQVRRVTVPKGFNLTVTATVAPPYAPLTPPSPPGSAPTGAAGGGFPSAGGYPGGGGGYPGAGGYPGGGGGYPGAGGYPGGRPS